MSQWLKESYVTGVGWEKAIKAAKGDGDKAMKFVVQNIFKAMKKAKPTKKTKSKKKKTVKKSKTTRPKKTSRRKRKVTKS